MADRETLVVTDGNPGISALVALIAIIALVAVVWFFAIGPGSGSHSTSGSDNGPTINVGLPSAAPNPS